MNENSKKVKISLKILELIYVILITIIYIFKFKINFNDIKDGGIGKFSTILIGIGVLVIYVRLFVVKRIFRWYEYVMIILNIIVIIISADLGMVVSVTNYMMLLIVLYILYYPSIKNKIVLSKMDKFVHAFTIGALLIYPIFMLLIIIKNNKI